jgi:hypothetical protein
MPFHRNNFIEGLFIEGLFIERHFIEYRKWFGLNVVRSNQGKERRPSFDEMAFDEQSFDEVAFGFDEMVFDQVVDSIRMAFDEVVGRR